MKSRYFKWLLFIYIVLGNAYIFFCGPAKEQFAIEKSTRHIYQTLTEEITHMGGSYEQFGGRIIRGFILVVKFTNSESSYDISRIFKLVEELGFTLRSEENHTDYVFCKNNSGFVIYKKAELKIYYDDVRDECSKK